MKTCPSRTLLLAAVFFCLAACTSVPAESPSQPLKPIARWSTVPFQRIEAGQELKCGVVAFSKNGIAEVRFTISHPGYNGAATVSVSEMSHNDQTGVYEYWTSIKADDFTSDGVVVIEATVRGGDGGVRDKTTGGGGLGLDPLPLVVNPKGSLPRPQAWVSHVAESDARGSVNNPNAPFATIGGAIDALRRYRLAEGLGDNADGGIVRLVPSEQPYVCSSGNVTRRIPCKNEWLTITPAEGGNLDNTRLIAPGVLMPVEKVCLRDLTLQYSGAISIEEPAWCSFWVDGCALFGDGQGISGAHPLLRSTYYKRLFYTDSLISQTGQAASFSAMCRGLKITHINDDAFQNVPLVINCEVDNVQPIGPDGELNLDLHADAWQHWGGNDINRWDDNVIAYGLRATDLGYQNLFIRGDIYNRPSYAQGMAFVNVYMKMNQRAELLDRHGNWSRWVDHLLWWHCSFAIQGITFSYDDYYYNEAWNNGIRCEIRNFSCVGCDFAFIRLDGTDAGIDWSGWDSNHFVYTGKDKHDFVTRGTNVTTGNRGVDTGGMPLNNSPLLQRVTPVVPVDAANQLRGPRSDVGAFQRIDSSAPDDPVLAPEPQPVLDDPAPVVDDPAPDPDDPVPVPDSVSPHTPAADPVLDPQPPAAEEPDDGADPVEPDDVSPDPTSQPVNSGEDAATPGCGTAAMPGLLLAMAALAGTRLVRSRVRRGSCGFSGSRPARAR